MIVDNKIREKTAELLLEIKAVSFSPKNPFKFTSGILSPVYIDNRIVMSYPRVREKIINFYIDILKNEIGLKNIELLSGTATAAIPHTAFIAQKLNLPMVYVRDTKKGHGKKNQIEGVISRGQKVVVIEDHISTAGSLVGNVKAVRNAGGIVKYALATTTFLIKKSDIDFKKYKVKTFLLTDIKKITQVAINNKILNKEDRNLILAWSKNPQAWGKKFGFE